MEEPRLRSGKLAPGYGAFRINVTGTVNYCGMDITR